MRSNIQHDTHTLYISPPPFTCLRTRRDKLTVKKKRKENLTITHKMIHTHASTLLNKNKQTKETGDNFDPKT